MLIKNVNKIDFFKNNDYVLIINYKITRHKQ